MQKSPDAFRTISEVAEELDLPQHVLRFWETRFSSIRPLKRGGGRRYYRPDDVDLLKGIRHLLYGQGYTIKGVQRILREQGLRTVQGLGRGEQPPMPVAHEPSDETDDDDGASDEGSDGAGSAGPSYAGEDDRGSSPDHIAAVVHREGEAIPSRLPDGIRRESDAGRPGGGLAGDDILHLRGVLAELLECERILKSLQAE